MDSSMDTYEPKAATPTPDNMQEIRLSLRQIQAEVESHKQKINAAMRDVARELGRREAFEAIADAIQVHANNEGLLMITDVHAAFSMARAKLEGELSAAWVEDEFKAGE